MDTTGPVTPELELARHEIEVRRLACRVHLARVRANGMAVTWGMDEGAAYWAGQTSVLEAELTVLRADAPDRVLVDA